MYKYLLIILLSGCTAMSSPEAIVGCQAADAISTAIALNNGLVEANPLLAPLGLPGILLVKLGISFLLLHYKDTHPTFVASATAVTCGVAIHNFLLIP